MYGRTTATAVLGRICERTELISPGTSYLRTYDVVFHFLHLKITQCPVNIN